MNQPTAPVYPAPTHQELLVLHAVILHARDELIEMVETQGPPSAMWEKPRRYFEPETDTLLPFLNERLNPALDRIWSMEPVEGSDPANLVSEIVLYVQFFELVRREISFERFPADCGRAARHAFSVADLF